MLDIYKASAGSGKTFALTLEYFKIIFQNPLEYKNVLAVTFTNKATEEMKSRIINELHRLAEGEVTDYGKKLKEELHLDDIQLKSKASLLRTLLLHDYGRLSVTTIDRFFQRIIKAFTRELGIFPGYNVELDSDFVLAKAVDKVMQEIKTNNELKNWIKALMNSNVEEGKSWSVKSKIADLGKELFRENYMLFDKNTHEKFGNKQFLKAYQDFLEEIVHTYESEMTDIGKSALTVISQSGLHLDDFKRGNRGCAAWFYKLAEGTFEEPNATTRKGSEDSNEWFTQKSTNRSLIESIAPQLMKILKSGLDYYEANSKKYLSAIQLTSNLYQLGILNDLYQEVRKYCNDNGLMLLSDTTHILNELIANNDTSFLFEKCGNYYKHLMIDEFQDTSSMQWKNFQPLVVNSMSENCKTMIVGDVKQSIYRWRNGEWGLLDHGVESQFKELGVNNILLKDNWRSAKEIVEFNNAFFQEATRYLSMLYRNDAGEDDPRAEVISNAYKGLVQTPQKKKTGYVNILFGPNKKDEDAENQILSEVTEIIQDIKNRGGYLKDIVILVRGGKEGAAVANYLMEYNKTAKSKIPFISNDSLFIWSSPYVQFIVAILKYISDPKDMVNRAVILYFYRIFIKDKTNISLHTIFNSVNEENIFQSIDKKFDLENPSVMAFSLYETIETVINIFELKDKGEELPYLIAFQDVIYEYESNNSNSITLFLEWWEKEQDKRVLTTSEDVDAVRILTIHKSKGLEFEYVILPFCSWELDSSKPIRRIWCTNNIQGFNALDYAPLNYSSKLADTIFREDYLNEHLKAYIDNLNLLYVALTRPKTELYIRPYTPKTKKDGTITISDVGSFMFQILNDMEKLSPDSTYQYGEKCNLQRKSEKANSQAFTLNHYPVWQPEGRINVKYKFRDYTDLEDNSLSAIDEGKLLHEIFKSIKHADDVKRAIDRAYLSGLINSEERDEYGVKIVSFLENRQAAQWFSPECKVINERDILFPGGNKARPDRVVELNNKVYVIDYKFGTSEEKKYIKQVLFYCQTLKEMGYKNIEGYIWYVKLDKIIKV